MSSGIPLNPFDLVAEDDPDWRAKWTLLLTASLEVIKEPAVADECLSEDERHFHRARETLFALRRALASVPGVVGSLGYLDLLLRELEKLDAGQKSTVLAIPERKRRRGRPRATPRQEMATARVAACVEALIRAGQEPGRAAAFCCREATKAGAETWGRGDLTTKTVEEWHARFLSAGSKPSIYRTVLAFLLKLGQGKIAETEHWARWAIAGAWDGPDLNTKS